VKKNLSFLEEDLQLILIGGKGGVGKTTVAAAVALYLTKNKKDKKILIVSIDPAHSLGDSFNCSIGEEIAPIKGMDNLWGQELNAPKLGDDFKEEHGNIMKKLAERGTYFDRQDIEKFFSLSLPGLDEVIAIIEVANLLKQRQFDLIILDTAPTGHTIRLLSLPEHMEKWIEVANLMQAKHRYLARHFAGRYVKDEADNFLENMASDIKRVTMFLSDSQSTEFVPVTTPEPMSIYETQRLLSTLKDCRIPVRNIIVNKVAQERECEFCALRRKGQEESLREIGEKFGNYNLIKMPLFPHQIQGTDNLSHFGKMLFGGVPYELTCHPKAKVKAFSYTEARMSGLLEKRPKFLLFGGKGGVGKTSIAAASALCMARHNPDKKVLIFSTDPAHSLSDSFSQEIRDKITSIYYKADVRCQMSDVNKDRAEKEQHLPSTIYHLQSKETNLFALEIDAIRLFDDLKKEYRESIEEIFDKFLSKGIDIKFDREVMTKLISLSPPGLDEIMVLKKIMDLQDEGRYDFFILDTAPTGHLLRFLEIPDLIREWLNTFFRLLIKYKGVVHLGKAAEKTIELSKSVRKIKEALTDSQKTEFVAITIPEAMAVAETGRLLSNLKRLKIPCSYMVVNMVIPPTECDFCACKREEQQKYIEQFKAQESKGYSITLVPLFAHEISGIESLVKVSNIMYGN